MGSRFFSRRQFSCSWRISCGSTEQQQFNMASQPIDSIPEEMMMEKTVKRSFPRKRPGKASKKTSEEAFRKRIGTKVTEDTHNAAKKRLGTFANAHEILEEQLRNLQLAKQACARPLTVATRGAGVVASISYSKMVTTWQLSQIEIICNIHQYYRVTLWLIHYKMYLAQQTQFEVTSFAYGIRFEIPEEFREALAVQRQVPSILVALLGCIGKVDVDGDVWHSVYPVLEEIPDPEIAAQFLTPYSIRGVLDRYSNVDTPLDERRIFRDHCCIPGIQFDAEALVTNADQVYPAEYTDVDLCADLHAYSNLMQRVGHRLAPHFMGEVSWSGNATKSPLACTDPGPIRLQSQFSPIAPPPRLLSKRSAMSLDDALMCLTRGLECRTARPLRSSASVSSSSISSLELSLGASSLVGEQHPECATRLDVNGAVAIWLNPAT